MSFLLFALLSLFVSSPAFAWDKIRDGDDITGRAMSAIDYSPINYETAKDGYSFLIAGNLFGRGTNPDEPAIALTSNLEFIGSKQPLFFVGLGDMLWGGNLEREAMNFKDRIIKPLQMPFFVVPGPHDLMKPAIYEKYFGPTYYSFIFGSSLFVLLNTGGWSGECGITDDQYVYFKRAVDTANNTEAVKHVFFFSHKLPWAGAYRTGNLEKDRYIGLDRRPTCSESNFSVALHPLLMSLQKPAYWFAGDTASPEGGRPLYIYDRAADVAFIATSLSDSVNDHFLQVTLSKEGFPTIESLSLSGVGALPIETFTPDYWFDKMQQKSAIQ